MPDAPRPPSPVADGPPPQAVRPRRGEWDPRRVAAVLLSAGALLVLAAAVAFARVTWSRLGDAGRTSVLLGVTVALGLAVVPLARRLLVSADVVATLTALLAMVDAVLVHRWLAPGAPGAPSVAAVAAAVAVAALLTAVRLDLPGVGCVGVVVAQAVLPAAASPGMHHLATMVVVLGSVALVDAVALGGLPRAADVVPGRVRAALGITLTAVLGVVAALTVVAAALVTVLSHRQQDDVAVACGLLLLAGGLAALTVGRDKPTMTGLALVVAAGALVAAGTRTVPTPAPALALAALLSLVLAAARLSRRHQVAAAATGLGLAVGALLVELPALALALASPVLAAVGRSPAGDPAAVALHDSTLVPVLALLVLTGLATAVAGRVGLPGAPLVADGPLLLPAALPALALALGLPAVLDALVWAPTAGVLACLALLVLARLAGPGRGPAAALLALPAGLHALASTTADSPGRAVVEGLLLLVAVVVGAALLDDERDDSFAAPVWPPVVVPTAVAVLLGVALAGSTARLLGADVAAAGVVASLVAVAVLAAVGLADRLGLGPLTRGPVATAAEAAAGLGALVAVRAPVLDHAWLPAGLGVAGLALVVTAPRREAPLGRLLAVAGQALLLLAWAVRLQQTHVTLVEAWSLPLAVVLLGHGQAARRRDSSVPSEALLPGLLVGLVPSLLVELDHPGLVRSLAVLAAAVGVLVLGMLGQLRAPLLTGAAVLALLAGRQLAPLAVALPRDLVLAVAGAVLLGLGATYEQRHQDLRRVAHRVRTLG